MINKKFCITMSGFVIASLMLTGCSSMFSNPMKYVISQDETRQEQTESQNDTGNKHSPTVICAAITSQMHKSKLPTHVELDSSRYDMVKDSVILLEQLRTIDKRRLKDKVCHLDNDIIGQVNKALSVSLEMN